jgi:protocatechuate 3,4-dioxygenase beta subunit
MRASRLRGVAVLAALFISILASRPAIAADATSQPAKSTPAGLDLLVLDPDGKPISGAQVSANIDGKTSKVATHSDGHAQIPPPRQPNSAFTIAVHVNGLVDKSADWRNRRADPIPPTYTMKLEAGTMIRGKVVDDAGQPVADATVELWISKQSPNARERYSRNTSVLTSADGIWSLDGIPSQGATIRAGAWDYHYANGDYYDMKEPSAAELRDGSFTITLTRGVEVDCVVLKSDGTPLTGAHVRSGGDFASNTIPAQKVDNDGKAVYFAKPGEQVVLTVTATGYSTDLTHFIMGADKHEVSMKMAPSTPMTGQVVDPDGKPVANTWIYPDTWRGFRSLEVRIHADRNGKFIWKDPPTDEVQCDIDATGSGFIRQQNVPLTAGYQPLVVTVQRALRVTGTVVDAETNQPILAFRIIHGISFGKDQATSWERQQTTPGRDGQFQVTESWQYPGYAIRIEADGYTPAESRVYTADEKQVKLEFKLTKGKAITFTVLTPDGKPAIGAKVFLLASGQNMQVNDGLQTYDRESPQANADADGHCSFPAQAGSFEIVALSESGSAQIPSANTLKSGEVHLSAWAVIRGTLMRGTKPWAGQQIEASIIEHWTGSRNESHIFFSLRSSSKTDGTFTIDHVPPGEFTVGRLISQQVGRFTMNQFSQYQQLSLTAGQTAKITLGGKGRPVEGQITIPPSLAARHDWVWDIHNIAQLHSPQSELPMPDDVKKQSNEDQQKWTTTFMQSPAGVAYINARNKELQSPGYPLEISHDGKFRIDDVPAGTYTATISILAPTAEYGGFNPDGPLATTQTQFTMPEIPGGQSDDPLKLPPITLNVIPHLDVGDPFPDFTAKTADGKDAKLSAYKGKYVLLDFFYPMTGQTRPDLSILSSTADAFGGESRLCMLGINIVGPPETTKDYGQPNGLTWVPVSLQKVGGLELLKEMNMRTQTSIWLIGPDGKIIGKNLSADAIKSALSSALGPQGL